MAKAGFVSFAKFIDREDKNWLDLPQVNSHVTLGDVFSTFLVFYFLVYSRILLGSLVRCLFKDIKTPQLYN